MTLEFFFPEYFGFPLSLSFHQRPTLIFVYMLLLPDGQMGEAWEPYKKATLFRKSGSTVSRCAKCSAHESKPTTESIHNYNFTVILRQFRLPDTSVSWKPAALVLKYYNNFPTRHWQLSVKVQGVTFHEAITLAFISARNSYLT